MYLRDIAAATYVLVQARWLICQARQSIRLPGATHVIVRSAGAQDAYHLFTMGDALDFLRDRPDDMTVDDALDLSDSRATATLDAYADAETAPDRAVIIEDGRLIGFFDATVPPPFYTGTRDMPYGEFQPGAIVSRSLVADFPQQVCLGETVSLLVSLSSEMVGAGLAFALQIGARVDVIVQARRGFALQGAGEGSLVVADAEETLPLQFRLEATEAGPGRIRVLAFHLGQPLGVLTLAPTVVSARAAASQRDSHELPMAPITVHQPDLALLILEHQSDGRAALTFRLTASNPDLQLNLRRFGPIPLRTDPHEYFRDFFRDIEDLPVQTAHDKVVAEQRLAAKGVALFNAVVPEELRTLLWSLREVIQFVQVQSEEPYIPWELCKLEGRENGRIVEGPFLCEAFAMTRWIPEIPMKPALTVKRIGLVVPDDSRLPFAARERDYIQSLANAGRKVERVPARFLELRSRLASGEYDAWHFTGHSGFTDRNPDRSVMLLEDRDALTPEDLSGVVANLGLAKPLVVLNACQIGRSAMSLTDIGGWAARFLRAGAGAFIGAYWSIYDRAASDFAQALYGRLLKGIAIGKAVQEARSTIRQLQDPTWLAYTTFADPMAKVVTE